MIKSNKAYVKIDGEVEQVAAEFMNVTARMADIFGVECVLDMVEGALEEVLNMWD